MGTGAEIPIILGIIGAASTGAAMHSANVAREDAKSAKRGQDEKERGMREGLEKQRAQEEAMGADKMAKSASIRRQKALSRRGQSRADTILTSPLGLAASGEGYKKTLLGE
jgi:hypothetical protein